MLTNVSTRDRNLDSDFELSSVEKRNWISFTVQSVDYTLIRIVEEWIHHCAAGVKAATDESDVVACTDSIQIAFLSVVDFGQAESVSRNSDLSGIGGIDFR